MEKTKKLGDLVNQTVTLSAPLSGTANLVDPLNFSITKANTTTDGYVSKEDWNIFNNKQDALGFTPYNATNPDGFISGITSGMVTTALGFTPYNSTNPDGYITSSALTPYAPLSNPTFTGDVKATTNLAKFYLGNDTITATSYAIAQTATNEISFNTPSIGRLRANGTAVATWGSSDFTINILGGLVLNNTGNDGKITFYRTSGSTRSFQLSTSEMYFYNNTAARIEYGVTNNGNFYIGSKVALATTVTDGFFYLPTCAGVPTGVPTAITGKVPMIIDSTNNRIYIYSNSTWKMMQGV